MFQPEADEEEECSICIEFRTWFHQLWHNTYEFIHWIAHLFYFATVYLEGHGLYATMGGVLLALTIIGIYYSNTD